jgi:transcriptional regulator with XRE-family HTH domain
MATDSTSIPEFGERLRQARLAQSRSLDELAAQTRIHRRHLEAIESGRVDHLPEGPYVKAFIREYARSLGVPVPAEFAIATGAPSPSAKDPKVVSRPASGAASTEEDVLPISAVAKETVRFANSAMSSAVRSVAKTTERMVDFVESGSKEAIDALTSKSLWDEADEVRRERLGLPPIEPKPQPIEEPVAAKPAPEPAAPSKLQTTLSPMDYLAERTPRGTEARVTNRGATNVIIALLVLLFAGAVFYAIRTYKREAGPLAAGKDYVPAPLDKPVLPPTPKRVTPAVAEPVTAPVAVGPKDSLRFQIRATAPVWISIAPDGVPAYRGELKAGEVRTFKAGDRLVINLGNQKSVSMSLDGRPITNLPTIANSGVVVRDLVLTHDHAQIGTQSVDLRNSSVSSTSAPAPSAPPATITPIYPTPTGAKPANLSTTSTSAKPSTPKPSTAKPAAPKSTATKPSSTTIKSGATTGTKTTSDTSTRKTSKSKTRVPSDLEIPPLTPVPARP